MKKIGFIGYGLRSETMMKAFTGAGLPLAPAAVADPRLETLQPQLARDGRFADTRYYADAEEMLDREALDAVFIGTRCGLHARVRRPCDGTRPAPVPGKARMHR